MSQVTRPDVEAVDKDALGIADKVIATGALKDIFEVPTVKLLVSSVTAIIEITLVAPLPPPLAEEVINPLAAIDILVPAVNAATALALVKNTLPVVVLPVSITLFARNKPITFA
jgi:hypothetical protein